MLAAPLGEPTFCRKCSCPEFRQPPRLPADSVLFPRPCAGDSQIEKFQRCFPRLLFAREEKMAPEISKSRWSRELAARRVCRRVPADTNKLRVLHFCISPL